MSKKYILHQEEQIIPQTALSVSEQIYSHAYHDSNRMFNAYAKALPLVALFSSITAAAIHQDMPTVKETITTSISLGSCATSLYLFRLRKEAQQKFNYLRKSFEVASQTFRERDFKLSKNLKKELGKKQPSFAEMIDFKDYPIRTIIAFSFLLPAATSSSSQPFWLSIGSTIFMIAVSISDQDHMSTISNKAERALQYHKKSNQIQISGYDI